MKKINDDDLLIAKVMDKNKQCERTNKLTYTDFLNEREQMIVLKKIKLENAFFFGGNYNSERKILIFYPDKLNEEMAKKNIDSILSVIRIELPNENKGKYEHRMYLSAIIKIGMDRSKVGDILVYENGADIITFSINKEFIMQGLSQLTRFKKANIYDTSINNVRIKEEKFVEKNIIVSSMRCDNIVAEIVSCSRNMAIELIEQERVLINYETVEKNSKIVNEGDTLTIRGKGKFIIGRIIRNTKNDRIVLEIKKYV